MKTIINWVLFCWRSVMDNRYNPLKHIKDPSIQFYFTMVLFIMWSAYFSIIACSAFFKAASRNAAASIMAWSNIEDIKNNS